MSVEQSIFYFAVYSAKLSIICLLRGAIEYTVGWWNLANTILFIVVVILGLWSLLSTILNCIPVAPHFSLLAVANADLSTMRCLPTTGLQEANRGLHIATDFCLFLFPVFLVWQIQLPWQRKALFILPFAFALVTITSSIMRNIDVTGTMVDITCQSSHFACCCPEHVQRILTRLFREYCTCYRMGFPGHQLCRNGNIFAICHATGGQGDTMVSTTLGKDKPRYLQLL